MEAFYIGGLRFLADGLPWRARGEAEALAVAYQANEERILDYLYANLEPYLDGVGRDGLAEALGGPTVEYASGLVSYLEADICRDHIVSFEHDGRFEKLSGFRMDG